MVVGRIRLCILFAIAASLAASPAAAEDPVRFDWRGVYIGAHRRALPLVDVGDPFGPSVFGDTVRTPGALIGGQLGYNWQRGACLRPRGGSELGRSRRHQHVLAYPDCSSARTARPYQRHGHRRGATGVTLPWDDRTLVHGKAGLALARTEVDALPSGGAGCRASRTAAGVGAGCWVQAWNRRSCRDGPSKRNTRF
jgi:opacity protein-like surface antigen